MMSFRLRWIVPIACVVATAGPGQAGGSSIASYTLTDLGVAPVGVSNAQPWNGGFVFPQIDNSGRITYARTGPTSAGGYSVTNFGSHNTYMYNAPGLQPVYLLVNEYNTVEQNPSNSTQTWATGINATGTAIGYARRNQEAFVYNPGGPTTPGQTPGLSLIPGFVPGTQAWYALGINSAGLIVGQAPSSVADKVDPYGGLFLTNGGRAAIFDGTKAIDLNTLIGPGSPLTLSAATSINDLGQIVGLTNFGADNQIHAFLLTPTVTPEPGAWALGIVVVGFAGMRRLA